MSLVCNLEINARALVVDLIVDGILRDTRLARPEEKIRKRTSTIDFSKGIFDNKGSLFECALRTSSLRQRMPELTQEKKSLLIILIGNIHFDDSKPPMIGTIEIQVWKDDHDHFHRLTAPSPDEWNEDLSLTMDTGGVTPTHEIK